MLFILALLFVDKNALFRFGKEKKKDEAALMEAVADLDGRAAETDNDLGADMSDDKKAE